MNRMQVLGLWMVLSILLGLLIRISDIEWYLSAILNVLFTFGFVIVFFASPDYNKEEE